MAARKVAAALLAVSFILVSCVVSAAPENVSREPVELSLANYWTGARISIMEAQLEEFHKLYPWITVKNQVTSTAAANMEKTYVAIMSGTPPDVWMVQRTQLPEFVEKGFLQPLDRFIAQDNFDMGIFYKPEQETCKYQGKIWSLPMPTGSLSLLFYNRALLAQGGVDPDKPPTTWTQLQTLATRLQRVSADGVVQVGGGNIDYFPAYRLAQMAYTFGAEVLKGPFQVNYLSDKVREAANFVADYAARVPKGGNMANGTLVFETYGEWRYFTLKTANPALDLGISLVPHGPDGQSVNLFGGAWSYAMPAGVKHPYESWLLIKFLTTSEQARAFVFDQGRPSPVIKFTQDKRYFEQNPYWNVIGEALNRTITFPPSPVTQRTISIDSKYMAQLYARKDGVEAILTKLQNEIDVAIADYLAQKK